jgi:hypothetical protein
MSSQHDNFFFIVASVFCSLWKAASFSDKTSSGAGSITLTLLFDYWIVFPVADC